MSSQVLLMAAAFAADRHRGQQRKCVAELPYINHPLSVANLLANEGGITDIHLLTAALLHDTVEDTDTSLEELTQRFGSEVSQLVAEVTDDKSLEKALRKRLQIETAPHKSDRARQLKIADKICNIRDIDNDSPKDWDLQRKEAYFDWAEQVVAGCRGINHRLDQLFDEAVREARQRVAC